MKVLMMGWGYENIISGGMDVHLTHLTKNLCKEGIEIHLFLPKDNAPNTAHPNLTIHKIDINKYDDSTDMTSLIERYNNAIIKKSESLDFDIIHTHDWFGVLSAKKLAQERNKPWIHTVHSLEYMRCAKEHPSTTEIETIEKTGIKDSDAIITVSNLMKKEICHSYGTEPTKVNVIYNYTSELPKNSEKISRLDKIKNNPKVLCVSRLTFQKGIEHIIHASKTILKTVPDCRFIIIGDGHLKNSLIEFTKILDVKDSFIFCGFIPQKELSYYFKNADVFVMPSIWEPFGITCLDAIEFNIPVILSENVGAKELFKDCVLTHKTRSTKDLAKKTLKLLKDKSYSDEQKNKAKKKLKSIDNWNTIAKKTICVYLSA
ncbi:MAG: glycosyltransferase family 4 protein [archaeon]